MYLTTAAGAVLNRNFTDISEVSHFAKTTSHIAKTGSLQGSSASTGCPSPSLWKKPGAFCSGPASTALPAHRIMHCFIAEVGTAIAEPVALALHCMLIPALRTAD